MFQATTYTDDICRYLNGSYISKRTSTSRERTSSMMQVAVSTPPVYQISVLAVVLWREEVFRPLSSRLLHNLLDCISREREGEAIDGTVVGGVIQSYTRLGLDVSSRNIEEYEKYFERPFLDETRAFCMRQAAALKAENSVTDYMKKAEQRLVEEEDRARRFLDPSSLSKTLAVAVDSFVTQQSSYLQEATLSLLQDDRRSELSCMWRLLHRVEGGINPMLDTLQRFVLENGNRAVAAVIGDAMKNPKRYVETLLGVYTTYSKLVKSAFESDPAFVSATDRACRLVVNEKIGDQRSRSPELLAKYCDILLRRSGKITLTEMEIEQRLNDVIIVFKFVDEKDVFQKFYKNALGKRLIYGVSVSDDAEAGMIVRLKHACGYEYTSRLTRMFSDVGTSKDLNDEFHQWLKSEDRHLDGIGFNVQVLTSGTWPLQFQTFPFTLPLEIEKCVRQFQEYYGTLHQGRKLSWMHKLSRADVKCLHTKKPYELSVTTYQMAVLLLFNRDEALTLPEMEATTHLELKELNPVVASLVDAKILLVEDRGASKTYRADPDFKSPRLKLKISTVLQVESKEDTKETHKSIDEDRQYYLQAAIVRIMKTRKMVGHNDLLQEVIDQSKSRFKPNIPMIKKCVEFLIDKGYLERTKEERDRYQYLA